MATHALFGLLAGGAVFLIPSCAEPQNAPSIATPPSPPAKPSAVAAPAALPLRAVLQEPIDDFPTHFDPSGHLVARCAGPSCDVWERKNDSFRGSVPASRCAGWAEPTPDPAAGNPGGTLTVIRENDGISLRDERAKSSRLLVPGPRGAKCEVDAAWSADGASLALHCEDTIVVIDAQSGRVIDRADVPKATGFRYTWMGKLVVLTEDSVAGVGPSTLLTWKLPGKPEVRPVDRQGTTSDVMLDPVTGGAWVSGETAAECVSDTLSGPDGEWGRGGKDDCHHDSVLTVRAENPAGDAFVVSRKEETWSAVTELFNVVLLRPRFSSWGALLGSYSKVEDGPGQGSFHVALSRDGRWFVVVVDPVPGAPRSAALNRAEAKAPAPLDTAAVDRILGGAPVDSVDLAHDERAVLLRAKGITVALPLDGKAPARRLGRKEVDRIEAERDESPSGVRSAFSTSDGELFTRAADGVSMRPEGCWFPEGWGDESLSRIRVLAGTDAIDGRLLEREQVQSRFCSPSRFEAFVRGEPMPPRPEARIVVLPSAR
jgi:hypothetical protein